MNPTHLPPASPASLLPSLPLGAACALVVASALPLSTGLPARGAPEDDELTAPFTRMTNGPIATHAFPSISPAWGDFDGDGWLDLFVGNQSYPNTRNLLYRNQRDGTFAPVDLGPVVSDPALSSHAAAWGDYDNDGRLDLVVANLNSTQPNYLYRNLGDGGFTRETAASAGSLATDRAASVGVAWADYDGDGRLDLFVANGALLENQRDALYHNDGNGRFTRILAHPIATPSRRSTQGAWADFDNDGDPDLLVTHSGDQANSLFRNDGAGAFTDIATQAGLTHAADSVGAAWGDYDGDGHLDLIITSLRLGGSKTQNLLYHNRGDGTFERVTDGEVAGDSGHFLSCAWVDYDNDGWLDLYLTVPSLDDPSPTSVKNRLYRNLGHGTFRKVTRGAAVTDHGDTAGAAWGDYDNDGFPDLFVAFGAFSVRTNGLYHNDGNANGWLKVRCVGTVSNRSALGTRIRVRARIAGVDRWQLRQIAGSEGWLSCNSPEALVGLGDAATVDTLRVEWPSGIVQEFHDIPARTTLTLVEKTDLRIHPPAEGRVQVHLSGPVLQRYRLEASGDLSRWAPVASLLITNRDGTASHELPAPAPESARFFRALPEPALATPGSTP